MNIKNTLLGAALLMGTSFAAKAQSSKVQTAWRSLSDYKSDPDPAYLTKAREALDAALLHEDTKEKAKTWVYKAQLEYYTFKNNLKKEEAKLTTVTNKDEKTELAYGNVPLKEYEDAGKAMQKASELDKDKAYQAEMGMIGMMMMQDVNNLAYGRYKVKKFDEAATMFYSQYMMTKMMGKKDTNAIYNAVLSSQKAGKQDDVKKYAENMIREKVATLYTYTSLYDAKLALKDTAGALETLQAGRTAFPKDSYLMNKETEFYLQQGKQDQALANLDASIAATPNNAILYLVRGNVFDNLANPKESGKDKEKPKNYEELMGKAEADYIKASELEPTNFDTWYNTGALYNNWGGYYQAKADAITKMNTEQKTLGENAQLKFKKAIPALEKALSLKENDKTTMFALRKLYLLTGNTEGATKMSDRMKK